MTTIDHEHARALLAAHAVDAVADNDERTALEAHLEQCTSCRSQLDHYVEAAARLAPEIPPPPDLWDRIAAQLEPGVSPLDTRRRSRPSTRIWIGAAAAIALVAGIGLGQLADRDTSPTISDLAADARDDAGTRVLELATTDGAVAAEAILTRDGHAYLTNQALPDLGPDRAYQLWAFHDGQPVSIALLGRAPTTEAFRAPANFDRLAITDEPSRGSPAPTAAPIVTASG